MVNGGDSSQQKVLKLIQEKEKIEKEIEANGMILKSNNVGMSDALTDNEGFPRNDIDVHSIRCARNKIICLQNDLKLVMQEIEYGLSSYFNERKDEAVSQPSAVSQSCSQAMEIEEHLEPFLVVNLVSENSPGFLAGIVLYDQIVSFGSINSNNFKNLGQIGELVKNSENHPVKVRVRRNGNILELIVVPKVWSGQGLLGFKVASINH